MTAMTAMLRAYRSTCSVGDARSAQAAAECHEPCPGHMKPRTKVRPPFLHADIMKKFVSALQSL
jgi:hypothetical protein